jgi:phytoene synthase
VKLLAQAEDVKNANMAVRGLVKRFDRDRYWSALFAPEPVQSHLLALYAFNIDLSRIPEQVSDAMFGEVRLQWWRDALDLSSEGETSAHPVAAALAQVRVASSLPESGLREMVDARMFDLGREPMSDYAALKKYLAQTAGNLFKLAAKAAGGQGEGVELACDAAAMAYGLTGLLRALPLHASKGRLFLPVAHFKAHNVETETVLYGEMTPQLSRALQELMNAVRQSLTIFRQTAAALPPELLPVFLPLTAIEPSLVYMSRPQFNPLQEIVQINPAMGYMRQWRAFLRGRV